MRKIHTSCKKPARELHDGLVAAMMEPSFYPKPPGEVTHKETHISHLFFVGDSRLQDQKGGSFFIPRLFDPSEASSFSQRRAAAQSEAGAFGLSRHYAHNHGWRGLEVGRQGAAGRVCPRHEATPGQTHAPDSPGGPASYAENDDRAGGAARALS